MHLRKSSMGQMGFTLIELIATMIIFSVLAAVLIPKYIDVQESSRLRAIDLGIAELNGRETLTWALVKLSDAGYTNDDQVWPLDTNIGADYDWTVAPNKLGGTLRFKLETSAVLIRSISGTQTPGRWRR